MKIKFRKMLSLFLVALMTVGFFSTSAFALEFPNWTQKANMLENASNFGSAYYNGKMYAIGGVTNDKLHGIASVEEYDLATDTWSYKKDMSVARVSPNVAEVDGIIYVMGGRNTSYSGFLNTVEAYNPVTNSWTKKSNMPASLYCCGVAVMNKKIYLIGGIGGSDSSSVDSVYMYDPSTDSWSTKASLPNTPRGCIVTATLDNKIYTFGGQSIDANTFVSNVVQVYDTQTNSWSSMKPMPNLISGSSAFAYNGKIYLLGGRVKNDSGLTYQKEIKEYNPIDDSWNTVGSLPAINSFFGFNFVNNTMYVYGGSRGTNNYNGTFSSQVEPNGPTLKLSVLLNEGETVQLSTSFNLDNNKNFTWSSTNESVATVDANGKVTAISEGTADIYAQNADGTFKEYIPVKVVKGVADELRLAVHLKAGETANLYLTDDSSKVTWSSMDNSIATVSAYGKVTGVKKGLAIIKGELEGKSYQIYVRVNG